MAKDLVRTRAHIKKFMLMRANIQAVSMKVQTLRSQNAMAEAMRGVTKAMANMNRQLKLPQIQKILQEFEKQSEIMDMKEEMMNDVMDDALGDEDDEEQRYIQLFVLFNCLFFILLLLLCKSFLMLICLSFSDAVVTQILDELGLQLKDQMSGLPSVSGNLTNPAQREPVAAAVSDSDADLQARLDNLRRE